MAPCTWWAIAAPVPAASPPRTLAIATSPRPISDRAQASAAASAAALAAATSPASVARLCWTAWNFAIGRPNCERSSACWTDCSRILSSAPAICCNRTAAPKPTSRSWSSATGCTAAGMAPSNDTSSLGSPARLLDWLTAKPAAATSATEIVGNPRQRQSRFFKRAPQRLRPHALLGVVDRGGLAQILEDPGRGIDDGVVGGIVHLATAPVVPAGSDRRAGEGGREAAAAI